MKSLNKSVIAVAVFSALFAGSMNVANAAEALINTSDGSNVVISVKGQDESIKSYDLDQIDNNTNAIISNKADSEDKINAVRGDLTAEANERISNNSAQNQNITANTTAIGDNSLRISQTDNHLQSVDNQVQDLKIDHIQDRQELANHDAAIKTLDSENTRQEAYIQSVDNSVTKEVTDRKAADIALQNQVNSKVDTTTYNDDQKAQNDAHQQLVQRVTLDEQYDGAAISQNRANIETLTARQQGQDLEQANRDRTANQHPAMTNGKDGATGATGVQGLQGLKGDTGVQGLVGAAGKDGADGKNGIDGKAGKDGVNGSNGKEGKNGVNGKDGANGVTTIITKKEVDTKTINLVKSLNTQTTAQAKDLKAAQQVFAQAQSSSNAQFKNLKDEVDDNKKEARGGVASAVAIASMPQVEKDQAMMFSAGVGSFKNEQAISVGASFHAGEHTVIKAGISDSTNNDLAMGAGIGIGF
ncbi:YadA C-terminal domain-containing protein [Enterobacter mori]|uniref:YadA C-terminal domain-containing protein n=1 Tax=Enterobacter mori TaxID=539813 RepID=UPI001C34119C|nr:YadA C-terminal domain-containing protein [Enterobacter mori]QWC65605.1 YadA-like family protein [Enterobacter mori]